MNINFFMNKALDQANKALLINEVPIGAILVDNKTHEIMETVLARQINETKTNGARSWPWPGHGQAKSGHANQFFMHEI